jgi:hypothetical protein
VASEPSPLPTIDPIISIIDDVLYAIDPSPPTKMAENAQRSSGRSPPPWDVRVSPRHGFPGRPGRRHEVSRSGAPHRLSISVAYAIAASQMASKTGFCSRQ